MIRKLLLGAALFLVICGVLYFRSYRNRAPEETVYAANRQVIVWNTSAQVREPVVTVNFGTPLRVLRRFESQVNVRTAAGIIGWVSQDELLTADFWKQTQDLETEAAKLPIEAWGHTHVLTNMHITPGRATARIRQLSKDIPVDMIRRDVEAIPDTQGTTGSHSASAVTPPTAEPTATAQTDTPGADAPGNDARADDRATDATSAPANSSGPKKEDWWFVRAHLRDQTTASGWVLGRFIQLDVPAPLPDYANAGGMRIVAWFELNRVPDTGGAPKPQYLLVGTRGQEGQPCDFLTLRVYTWGAQRQQYETAFVDSGVCGRLPVKITMLGTSGELTFSFDDTSRGAREDRVYKMQRTIVRRVKQDNGAGARSTTKPKHR